VVDNNSTDGTQKRIEEAARASAIPMRYAFEARQGKSFALHTGLTLASGDALALTDDDVTPAWPGLPTARRAPPTTHL
jgi:glycosyltransferase involved in cell wall biosynthesis